MSGERQNEDGSWSPAEPIGWLEEHNWLQRLIFWLRRIEHCNDREGQRRGFTPRPVSASSIRAVTSACPRLLSRLVSRQRKARP